MVDDPNPGSENQNSNNDNKSKDDLKNIKSEFDRKMQNIQDTNSKLVTQNTELNSKFEALLIQVETPKKSAPSTEDLEDLQYTDPERYNRIKQEQLDTAIDEKINTKVNAITSTQDKKQRVLLQLSTDYPEINNENSDLYKKAIEVGKQHDAEFIQSPEGIKLAIIQAASELGLLPVSKRSKVDDDGDINMGEFIGGGSGDSGNRDINRNKKKNLDPKSIEVARLMGLNVEDKKVIEQLEKRNNRKSWTSWE